MNLYSQILGRGPPVVLTAGMGHTSAVWDGLTGMLSSRCTVLRWDYRGHGQSESTDDAADYGADLALADLIAMMGRAGTREDNQAVLIGHSLGGYLSLRAAVQVPQLVKALVLIATGPGFRDESAREKWNQFVHTMRIDAGVRPEARRMSLQSDDRVMQALNSIAVPTLVIVGGEDTHFIGAKEYLVRKMPNAIGVEIAGARHSVHVTHSRQVSDAISGFLDHIIDAPLAAESPPASRRPAPR
jgi:pimeloyl-ACP methyl ester carboxylesterase